MAEEADFDVNQGMTAVRYVI